MLGNNHLGNTCQLWTASGGVHALLLDIPFWQKNLIKKLQMKWSFTPGISQNCASSSWKLNIQYPRLMEIPQDFFLITPVNSILGPWNFHILFFNTPGSFMSSTPPLCFFSEIAHSHNYTEHFLSPISSFWVVNIMLQKFDTS